MTIELTSEETAILRDCIETGNDLPKLLFLTIYEQYCASGEMPYGTMKARTGDPDEWIADRLEGILADNS